MPLPSRSFTFKWGWNRYELHMEEFKATSTLVNSVPSRVPGIQYLIIFVEQFVEWIKLKGAFTKMWNLLNLLKIFRIYGYTRERGGFHRLRWGKGRHGGLSWALQGKENSGDCRWGEATRQDTSSGEGGREGRMGVVHLPNQSTRCSLCMIKDKGEMRPTLGAGQN